MNGISGPIHRPGDAGYDTHRAGYNRVIEHKPALVVEAADADDVAAAVRLAAAEERPVAVQATGHGPAVPADDAVLVHTGRMAGVRVDPTARTARVAAGARWRDVLAVAVPHGLAPLNGSSPVVGVVGYTTGGGVGMLGRRYGFAADHVRAIDLVTADGRLRRLTATEEPDLFWAVRGGKGNFGVVTALEIDLFPVTRLYGGGLYFGAEAVPDALRAYAEWTRTVPDEMTSSVLMVLVPDIEAAPAPLRGRYVMHLRIAWCGAPEEGERLVAPLRAAAPALMDTLGVLPYERVGSIHHEPTDPAASYGRNVTLRALEPDTVAALLAAAGPDAGAPYAIELRHLGGAYGRPPAVPNAVGGRDAAFSLSSMSFADGADLAALRAAHEGLHERLRPWLAPGLVNFLGVHDATGPTVRAAFGPERYERLVDVKTEYDPANLFRINHNIPPRNAPR
ncbi:MULTISPECIES: FAD-binding oxidoreductase [Micromonospora]|uniref:FAD-binding oxidoreductase n=1 Tax=Micromonospora solifontis TaxID=2487138 RepID=A0ABX9WFI7_9ACTN|nr:MULTISPECIES: FAD-binding oxidoreductase [Micromonospora]NES15082.1 FAD-binding oxidoreductase [Micromonospora sp. PPF5-17B]NES37182.1 FAD-binding oxidoreductase [Micromonospora solifontis]NES56243.1 FAD-binding oxidoreductase [Micromonospora sp. PPF5-6]RNL98630.1 FAD-binding oxidoreductase [Micromonospora solifontis]